MGELPGWAAVVLIAIAMLAVIALVASETRSSRKRSKPPVENEDDV